MASLLRTLTSAVVCTGLLFSQAQAGVNNTINRRDGGQSIIRVQSRATAEECVRASSYWQIYDLDQDYVVPGVTMMCERSGLRDGTPPPYNIKPGQQLFISYGRFTVQERDAFLRGQVNTEYFLPKTVPFAARAYTPRPSTFLDADRVLPFYPKAVYKIGDTDQYSWYSYGNMEIIPSLRSAAYPLNEKSMIVAVDGYALNTPEALAGYLREKGAPPYIEIVYYQVGEEKIRLRRALIPTIERATVEREWRYLAQTYPVEAYRESSLRDLIGAVSVMALASMVFTLTQSESAKKWSKDNIPCIAGRGPNGCY